MTAKGSKGRISKNLGTHTKKFIFCYGDRRKPLKNDKEHSGKTRFLVV